MINKGQIFPEMTRMRGRYFGEDKCEGQGIRGNGNHSDEYREQAEETERWRRKDTQRKSSVQ